MEVRNFDIYSCIENIRGSMTIMKTMNES